MAMFCYGSLAAKASIHIIDVSRIDDNIAKVMRQCAAAPNLTVPRVFWETPRLPARVRVVCRRQLESAHPNIGGTS